MLALLGAQIFYVSEKHMQNLHTCKLCERLSKNFIKLRQLYPDYSNQPIYPLGIMSSRICIVGLAPGLHGANRTGKPFHGDFSGNILFDILKKNNLSIMHTNTKYKPIYITNSVKCYPPKNQPKLNEIKNCLFYLTEEFSNLKKLKIIVALGHIAHNAVLRAFSLCLSDYHFNHGKIHEINCGKFLLDSYHCSKMNINAGRLTKSMLSNIFKTAKKIAYK